VCLRIMDHLSSKLCAAAGFTWNPSEADMVAIATILEKVRMNTSQKIQCPHYQCAREALFRQIEIGASRRPPVGTFPGSSRASGMLGSRTCLLLGNFSGRGQMPDLTLLLQVSGRKLTAVNALCLLRAKSILSSSIGIAHASVHRLWETVPVFLGRPPRDSCEK
jgi:hypothetical protein